MNPSSKFVVTAILSEYKFMFLGSMIQESKHSTVHNKGKCKNKKIGLLSHTSSTAQKIPIKSFDPVPGAFHLLALS